jgi:hypothetical protein
MGDETIMLEFQPMMSARQAMARALRWADEEQELERARLWLDIARELRAGEKDARPLRTGGIVKPRADVEEWFTKAASTGKVSRDVPTEVIVGHDPGTGQLAFGQRFMAGATAPERAETVVMQRAQDESTPAYEEAGQTLGDTQGLPRRIATPCPVHLRGEGYTDTCITPGCEAPIVWSEQLGWRHAAGQTLACPEQG